MKNAVIALFDVVSLKAALPAEGLVAGQRGAVVEIYSRPDGYEVEFVDDDGYTVALVAVTRDQIDLAIPHAAPTRAS